MRRALWRMARIRAALKIRLAARENAIALHGGFEPGNGGKHVKREGGGRLREKPAVKHDFVLSSGGGMGHHAAAH